MRGSVFLCRHCGVDFASCLEPCEIRGVGVLFDQAKELDGFRLVAGFRRIVDRDDHFYFDGHDVSVGLDESCFFDTLSGDLHVITCRKNYSVAMAELGVGGTRS